ncbi:MAG: LPS-assembly protein LptD [Rhizobiales bacterium]|nr:LPS-assembly protein LptD [Hyphomicrobiales bacterium]
MTASIGRDEGSHAARRLPAIERGVLVLLLSLILMLTPDGAKGQAVDAGEGPVLLLAETVDVDEPRQIVTASGDVEITRGERRLLADKVRYYQAEDRIEAIGNVTLLEPGGEAIYAELLSISGDLKDGVIEGLRARLDADSRLAAASARRIDGARTEMDRAVYSPCPLCAESDEPPLWQITASKVTHDANTKDITYKHAFFELYGVPVLYTPYFSHPDPSVQRRSGFLSPSVGSETELGFTLETPYYFALAPNYDLTLAPIFTTEEGVVLASEYRHRLRNGRYDLGGSITRGSEAENDDADQATRDEVRGHVVGDGKFALGGGWDWGYDLLLASDDTYLKRYDFSDLDILENRLFTEKIDGRNYFGANTFAFQGLRESDDQGLIPVVLPLLDLEMSSAPMLWGSRFFLDSSFLALNRTDGLDTRRLSTTGGWELPWLGQLGDQYRLKLSLRGDYYDLDGDPETLSGEGSRTETRLIPRATLDWSWPWVGDSFGLTPIIEPISSLTLAPNGLNDDDIPNEDSLDLEFDDTNLFEESRFPGLDQVEEGSRVSYGLRFGGIGETGEVVNALFGQSWRFQKDDQFDADTGLDGRFSDFVGRVEAVPADWLRARYRFRLDRDTLAPVRNEVRATLGPSRLRFDVNYLSLEDDPSVSEEEFREREEITAGLQLGLGGGLTVRAQTRRDLRADRTVANTFGLIYRHPCLILIGGVEQNFTEDRDAGDGTTISLRLTFQNLGEVGGETSVTGF